MKDLLSWDQTLFKDSELFELDHIPEHFLHRDAQLQALMYSIRPALSGSRPLNCLCIGAPGTGKTTAVFKVFEEIEKHTPKIVPVLVNCQLNSTRYAVFSQIFKKLIGYAPPSSGVSFKKVFGEVAKYLAEKEKVLVVALDDMNYLFYENEVNEVLYSLLRAHETHPGARVGVIAVLSDTGVPHILDQKVESVFLPEEIKFPQYSKDEIMDILSNRAKLGFYPNVLDDSVLERITEHTFELGDLRVGIDLLKRAGFNAEKRASRTIALSDVELAYEKSRLVHLSYIMRTLKKDEKTLLGLILDSSESNSGELYEKFHSKTNLGYTRFYEMLNKLNSVKLIDADFTGKGARGRSRVVTLRYPVDEVKVRL
ncbi:MAG: ORC1-type DNA replication protein [Candidatus Methanoperedens sp.]|nr:ORC1-type DNA replication protein [Candidatus Methanoperedens sp.]MCZ7371416.1 ORC1-type DNA replication protein [Candidatus Methanoperedens sp.]